MHIAIIGAGNVATVLARLLKQNGHTLAGIYSASIASAQVLAREVGALHYGNTGSIANKADMYIIAVNDTAIAEISSMLALPGKIVVHTSGATPKNILGNISANHGVLYPLQSLRKEAGHRPLIPFLIDGSDHVVHTQIRAVAESISPLVHDADDSQRLKLHLAAVMVSNFTNFLYTLGEDYCTRQQIPFKALVPLIEEVAARTALYSPATMQTGPAVRGDMATIEKHLALLSEYPLQKQVYQQLTNSIMSFYNTGGTKETPPENRRG